ncbi:MAG: S9 family peptidase, partial [Candidatus Riflebacteria bacterium]|nr:S9 family peptidase [Candidatus Riflebacteria bacterium]
NKDVYIDSISAFENYLVISERNKGLQTIKYIDVRTNEKIDLPFAESVYSVYLGNNPEYKTDKLRYVYCSLTTPESVIDYDFKTGLSECKKRREVVGNFDPKNYVSERIFATAKDGTEIPISLVYRKDMWGNGAASMYLTAYGAYGMSTDPYFSSTYLSLLDRGYVYAIAHIRGGQEMGRKWYNEGKLLNKKNSFTDFIACAEFLIEQGYTKPEYLAIEGGSAGGLLMGAVTNMRPDLFRVVVADVPFVDMMNTMLDPSLPLTVGEYEEWGCPEDKKYFDYMLSYSPYDNIEAKDYPNILVTAGLNDPRVSYWEPAKYVAKLRTMKTDNNMLLLKTNMSAGHMGASGRYDYLKEIAFSYAFIFKVLGTWY